jgi:two-component system alkaline phosphatase synthesis response regulator PhoP
VQPKRILIVDDEAHIREIAAVSLELTGAWEIVTADCGAEALRVAANMKPDAILLDVMMPEMDGPTTFRLLQADPATHDIPVIFLTAKVQTADKRRFTELGVRTMIAKPFDPLSLGRQVAAALEWN